MPDSTNRLIVFAVLAVPFYVNDFAFIALDGTYGVYLADYATRALVLGLCFLWPASRALAEEDGGPGWPIMAALLTALLLPVFGRTAHHLLEVPLAEATGVGGLFAFPAIDDATLYGIDLTVGLLAVAISEELVFRKLALGWLESAGRRPAEIIVLSALLFSSMHWGSGPARLLYTFVAGLVYMAAYLRIRRLWPLIAAHWIENVLAFGPADLPVDRLFDV